MCTATQCLQWKKIILQTQFSLLLATNKGAAQSTVFQSKKIRNSFCSDQNGRHIVGEACSVSVLSSELFTDVLVMLDHLLMCLYKNTSFVSCFLGENVKEFFSRVAALAFEQSMIKELENNRGYRAQIGAGNLISMWSFAFCVHFPCL